MSTEQAFLECAEVVEMDVFFLWGAPMICLALDRLRDVGW